MKPICFPKEWEIDVLPTLFFEPLVGNYVRFKNEKTDCFKNVIWQVLRNTPKFRIAWCKGLADDLIPINKEKLESFNEVLSSKKSLTFSPNDNFANDENHENGDDPFCYLQDLLDAIPFAKNLFCFNVREKLSTTCSECKNLWSREEEDVEYLRINHYQANIKEISVSEVWTEFFRTKVGETLACKSCNNPDANNELMSARKKPTRMPYVLIIDAQKSEDVRYKTRLAYNEAQSFEGKEYLLYAMIEEHKMHGGKNHFTAAIRDWSLNIWLAYNDDKPVEAIAPQQIRKRFGKSSACLSTSVRILFYVCKDFIKEKSNENCLLSLLQQNSTAEVEGSDVAIDSQTVETSRKSDDDSLVASNESEKSKSENTEVMSQPDDSSVATNESEKSKSGNAEVIFQPDDSSVATNESEKSKSGNAEVIFQPDDSPVATNESENAEVISQSSQSKRTSKKRKKGSTVHQPLETGNKNRKRSRALDQKTKDIPVTSHSNEQRMWSPYNVDYEGLFNNHLKGKDTVFEVKKNEGNEHYVVYVDLDHFELTKDGSGIINIITQDPKVTVIFKGANLNLKETLVKQSQRIIEGIDVTNDCDVQVSMTYANFSKYCTESHTNNKTQFKVSCIGGDGDLSPVAKRTKTHVEDLSVGYSSNSRHADHQQIKIIEGSLLYARQLHLRQNISHSAYDNLLKDSKLNDYLPAAKHCFSKNVSPMS
eukprot:scaffold11975_cov1241-Chaetoceros_neogracile.AAC.1